MVLPFNVALYSGVSVAALFAASGADAYAVGGNAPEFVADFAGTLNSGTEYYRSGGSDTTFSSVFTHSGLVAPATMTDSDGVLKWAPHNYQFDTSFGANWGASGGTKTTGQTDYLGGSTAVLANSCFLNDTQPTPSTNFRVLFLAKAGTATNIAFGCNASGGNRFVNYTLSGAGSHSRDTLGYTSSSITALSDGWYLCEAVAINTGSTSVAFYHARSDGIVSTDDGTCYVCFPHVLRLDGLDTVFNPDAPADVGLYVPNTTTAARFLPRRNHYIYNGSTYDNAGILIEPAAATNLVTQSNDLSTTWALTALNRAQLGTPGTGPDGVSNSAQLVEVGSTAGSTLRGYLIGLTSTAVAHTYSVYLKKASGGTGWVWLATFDATGGIKYSYFDLNTGTVGTAASGHTLTIENVKDGWYRCCVVNTYSSTTTMRVYVGLATSDGVNTVDQTTYPQGTGWFYHYGSQSEVGSVQTSYIPTSGSTVTRAAETLTVAGANLPANTTGVSVQMQGRMTYADLGTEAQRTFWRWYNGASDFLLCDLDTDGADTGEVNANQSDTTGGSGTVAIDAYSPGINVAYNIASRHSNTDINLAVDGTAGTADATPTALHDASSDTFQVAHNLQGSVGMLRVWGVGLSDTDLEGAS